MNDTEFKWLKNTVLCQYFCFILFPADLILFIIFGYRILSVTILEIVLLIFNLVNFILRTLFLVKYPHYNRSQKRFLFETISYCASVVFAVATAFLVKYDGRVWSYYDFNIYIQPAFIIFTFVILGYFAQTANRIAKNFVKENKERIYVNSFTEEQKNAVQQMVDLAEGRMTIREFWELYQNSAVLQDIILNDQRLPQRQYIVDQFNKVDINILGCRVDVYTAVECYFSRRNKKLKFRNSDVSLYCKLLDLLPNYIDMGNGEFFANIMANAPEDLKSKERDSWFRGEIRRLFTWDKKKPNWIQPPQWPIVDNVPYVFSHQETAEEGYELYYFYDPNDKAKTVVIEQCE